MDELLTLVCPTCGVSLHVAPNTESVTCDHCGAEYLVKSSAGFFLIEPLREGIRDGTRGSERTAAELAIRRLAEGIAATERQLESLRRDRSSRLTARDRRLSPVPYLRILGVTFFVAGFVVAACSGVFLAPSTIQPASAIGLSLGALFAAIGLALLIAARPANRTGG